jgi:hypothetical protein
MIEVAFKEFMISATPFARTTTLFAEKLAGASIETAATSFCAIV